MGIPELQYGRSIGFRTAALMTSSDASGRVTANERRTLTLAHKTRFIKCAVCTEREAPPRSDAKSPRVWERNASLAVLPPEKG